MKTADQGIGRGQQQRYTVVPRTLIFLTSTHPQHGGREILLIKGAPDKRLWAGQYNGIGGHVEGNEDVLAAAQRELHEETGLSGVDLALRGVLNIAVQPGGAAPTGVAVFLFWAEIERTEHQMRAGREGELAWLPLADLADYPLVDDLYQLIPLLAAGDASVYGHYSPQPDGTLRYAFRAGQETG